MLDHQFCDKLLKKGVILRNLDFLSQPSALAPRKQKPSALVGIPVFDTDITRQLYGEENV